MVWNKLLKKITSLWYRYTQPKKYKDMISKLRDRLNPPPPSNKSTELETNQEDCLSCRVIGTSTFAGLTAYTLYQRSQIPTAKVLHRGVTAGLAFVFAGVAFVRATL